MKFCIAFMFMQESSWLKLHLPVFVQAVDGIVAVDGGSTDGGAAVIESLGGRVFSRPWDWKPLDQENFVIQMAELCGYDAILLTAPDELWFPEHIYQMRQLLESTHYKALSFPTFNFMIDRTRYSPIEPYYPDVHIRAWRLHGGIIHEGELDSGPNIPGESVLYLPHIHLFHYAHIKDRKWYTLKGLNFHRVKAGLEPLAELPPDVRVAPYPLTVEFVGVQPLDPQLIGVKAPCE